MQRQLDIRTPESIAFSYELAGLGSRFLALVLDMIVQVAILVALLVGVSLVISRVPPLRHAVGAEAEKIAGAIAVALIVVVVFLIFFGYFIAFEAFSNGQTPGKRVLGIRVVRDGGYPLDFGASLIRNLIRVGELTIGFYALSAVSMLVSPENKRLGDIAAGTIVVRDARLAIPKPTERPAEPTYSATRYLSGDERALIRRFLDRRDALAPQRRRELAAQLASRVRERVPPELQRLDDESLLERL
ncbi:MAG: RDD family protein [Candidatus Eremiobacteraeota bacterium]|nr:RDD family protein [Candidatus Eremiobacteraeota bacterium]